MMAGNPNCWSMNSMLPQLSSQLVYGSDSPLSSNPSPADHRLPNQDFPVRSWSQLLLGGLGGDGEEERIDGSLFQQQKMLENLEDQVLNLNPSFARVTVVDVKHEIPQTNCQIYSHVEDEFQANSWPSRHQPVILSSSPSSCITASSNNVFDFSRSKLERKIQQHNQDRSLECNSTGTGGVTKKARVQGSAQPALKVRKEKLGDRITTLHQLVSPFGKTDTASVLSEAIGYIRFLQSQIEALSSPYMCSVPGGSAGHRRHSVQERNCLFPEEPSQFLNEIGMEGRGLSKQDSQRQTGVKDLGSRGLCLVPISCTQHVGNINGADYWAPAAFSGGF